MFPFTYLRLEEQFQKALDLGYEIITCNEYVERKRKGGLKPRTIVNRIDIDFSVKKAEKLGKIFDRFGIKGTFFIRLHAHEYNPFSFENYRIIKGLIHKGNEIGYHSEVIDESVIWGENPQECLKRDVDTINMIFGIKIKGVASHGGLTGLNNLDFWKENKPSDFNLQYEGYDQEPEYNLFHESFYISDSEWTRWKCYNRGIKVEGDHRTFGEHLDDGHPLIHLLIHSDTYFENHFYE